jgi:hypothetical protein
LASCSQAQVKGLAHQFRLLMDCSKNPLQCIILSRV